MFRIACSTQSYDWGKLGSESKAAQLAVSSGLVVQDSTPYAELWMGTHPNAPSKLYHDPSQLLKSVLSKEILSEKIYNEYSGDLPFLFKVLSARKTLSIQAHPDKELAKRLYKEFPKIYKDENHKPEMAIGLTSFEAMIGFRPIEEIQSNFDMYFEIKELLGPDVTSEFMAYKNGMDGKRVLKLAFKTLMESDPHKVESLLKSLISRINSLTDPLSSLLKRVHGEYPGDVGVFCILFLNYVRLGPGDAIFLAANEPHAYISGDCVECMAASDNVVRSGLTPKFKDVNTLVDMLTYNYGSAESQILRGQPDGKYSRIYDPPIQEFVVSKTELPQKGDIEELKSIQGPSICIVTQGNGLLKTGSKQEVAPFGSVFFISSNTSFILENEGKEPVILYRAYCE